jgi:hypothetical protein
MGRWAASFPTRTRACPTFSDRAWARLSRKLPAVKSSKSLEVLSHCLSLSRMRLSTLLRNRPGLLGTGYVVAGFRPHHGPHTRQPEPSRVPAPARGACAYVPAAHLYVPAAHLLSIPCICVPKHAHLRVFFGHSACCSCHACHAAVGLGSEGTFYRCIRGVGEACLYGNVFSGQRFEHNEQLRPAGLAVIGDPSPNRIITRSAPRRRSTARWAQRASTPHHPTHASRTIGRSACT